MAEPAANRQAPKKKQTLWQVFTSTCAAAFGVQTDKNRERDFAEGKISNYIIAGIVFTVIFIAAITVIVRIVLSYAGL